jgi:hypothetical protein
MYPYLLAFESHANRALALGDQLFTVGHGNGVLNLSYKRKQVSAVGYM